MAQTEVKITQFISITKNKRKEEGDNVPLLRLASLNRGRVTVPLLFHCSTTFAYLIYILYMGAVLLQHPFYFRCTLTNSSQYRILLVDYLYIQQISKGAQK